MPRTLLLAIFLCSFSLYSCLNGDRNSGYTRTINSFVNSLNSSDSSILRGSYDSNVILYADETQRSGDWFVIYDDYKGEYKSIRVGYIRSMDSYYDYQYSWDWGDEFRYEESWHHFWGHGDGDRGGDNYEVVDLGLDGYFYGRESGYQYEDEEETYDVNLQVFTKERLEYYRKSAIVSYTFSINIASALKIVWLGEKLKSLKNRNVEFMTDEDKRNIFTGIEKITGVTVEEFMATQRGDLDRDELLSKVAKKLGTNKRNLEDYILPELLGFSI